MTAAASTIDQNEALASITLLLDQPLGKREADLRKALEVLGVYTLDGVFPGMPFMASDAGCCGMVRWDDHTVRLFEVAAPAPGLDGMIQCTRMENSKLAPLKQHTSHVLCTYEGDAADPVLRVQAIFRVAAALVPAGVVGVIHTDGWQCFPATALSHLADASQTNDLREGAAQQVFCNLIPFHGEGGTWWASRGNHVFGVPNFALWDDGRFGLKPVREIFSSLFSYLKGGATILSGHTMELGGATFIAGEVTEFRELICGPGQTTALRPLSAQGGKRGPASGVGGRRGKVMVMPFLFGLFFLGLIFGVHPNYTHIKLVLGGLGAVCVLIAILPWLARR